jgi:hypothetical protein
MALIELGDVDEARRTIAVFAQPLEDNAEGMSSMVQAALHAVGAHGAFTVSANDPAAAAEDRPATPDQLARAAVELSAEWESPTELHVRVKVLDGFHLNANKPAQGMIPTTVAIAAARGASAQATVDYPPGEERKFAFASEAIRI